MLQLLLLRTILYVQKQNKTFYHMFPCKAGYYRTVHRCRNQGSRGSSCSPNKIIRGATSTSCSPNFFCNLRLKVTLQTVTLLLTQKVSKIPQLLGLYPRPHCTLCILFFSKNTYCIKLYFAFDCLDCFSPISAPQLKNHSRTYGTV